MVPPTRSKAMKLGCRTRPNLRTKTSATCCDSLEFLDTRSEGLIRDSERMEGHIEVNEIKEDLNSFIDCTKI